MRGHARRPRFVGVAAARLADAGCIVARRDTAIVAAALAQELPREAAHHHAFAEGQ
jgi:hypothetical protein